MIGLKSTREQLNPLLFLRLIFVGVFVIVASIYIFPYFIVNAQGCPDNTNEKPNYIYIQDGFLTINASGKGEVDNFASDSQKPCIIENEAVIQSTDTFADYGRVKTSYFNQASSSQREILTDLSGDVRGNRITSSHSLYLIEDANLVIDSTINVTTPVVIFVDNNLYIDTDLPAPTDEHAGLVFVVNGQININPGVTDVNAFFITYDQFCDSWVRVSGNCTSSNQQLNITGSIISLSPEESESPKFVRTSANSSVPAEILTYDPKYLVIFKEIFSRDKTVWEEI